MQKRRGYTLIELIVTIIVIAVFVLLLLLCGGVCAGFATGYFQHQWKALQGDDRPAELPQGEE